MNTITIDSKFPNGDIVQIIHTIELRFIVKQDGSRILQYRHCVIKNGFPFWEPWKDVQMVFEQIQE